MQTRIHTYTHMKDLQVFTYAYRTNLYPLVTHWQYRQNATHLLCNHFRRTAAHCNTLQHTATHCNALQRTATYFSTLQHTAAHCSTHMYTQTCKNDQYTTHWQYNHLWHTATQSNTLQHTATHCNTLQHTATHCNTLQHTATHVCTIKPAKFDNMQHTDNTPLATYYNTLQYTATHCSTRVYDQTCTKKENMQRHESSSFAQWVVFIREASLIHKQVITAMHCKNTAIYCNTRMYNQPAKKIHRMQRHDTKLICWMGCKTYS